jgi:hypothetical protein
MPFPNTSTEDRLDIHCYRVDPENFVNAILRAEVLPLSNNSFDQWTKPLDYNGRIPLGWLCHSLSANILLIRAQNLTDRCFNRWDGSEGRKDEIAWAGFAWNAPHPPRSPRRPGQQDQSSSAAVETPDNSQQLWSRLQFGG